ncbi:hypothetical protein BJF93_06885 [Xaviernesmea oryzae]|uniref:Uncharacterized protein n=2 Tax=Xaviernesmea oryzae TaxID=464029 RepID=A0A1Q9ASN6_9HYPH|nr:hypothetical protein BJF93_06885 [Xaviernesmea oryzae]
MPKGSAPDAVVPSGPCPADVQAEAARRLMTLNIGHWEARHRATGLPVPRDIARKRREIEFVAKALARLNVIPSDYHADVYWPLP